MLKILHTSDWHLGAVLAAEERIGEQKMFLDWLTGCIIDEQIDVLIVSGDIFDTYTPPVSAQNAYYQFLAGLIPCRHLKAVFITGGNHDSPAFLAASSGILSCLNIHVVSSLEQPQTPEPAPNGGDTAVVPPHEGADRGIFEVLDGAGNTVLVVCAVPFLREKDLRVTGGMDDETDIAEKTQLALAAHYQSVFEQAQEIAHNRIAHNRSGNDGSIPIVMTGHLYIAGSVLSDAGSERAREVGRLSSFPAALLPKADYIALGHLHKPQKAGGSEFCRYSGAPLPMSFSEAPLLNLEQSHEQSEDGKEDNKIDDTESGTTAHDKAALSHTTGKSVVIVEFENPPLLRLVETPEFRRLLRLRGSPDDILQQLEQIEDETWIEVQVTRNEGPLIDFWNKLAEVAQHSKYKILIKRDMRESTRLSLDADDGVELRALSPSGIFEQRLKDESLTEEDTAAYTKMFTEIYNGIIFENT